MTTTALCKAYLEALNRSDFQAILSLFEEDSIVVSPLYGTMPVGNFYPALFADTGSSATTLLNIYFGQEHRPGIAMAFDYRWTLKNGKEVSFSCVDLFELNTRGDKFSKLTIVYDTAFLRADFEASRTQSPPGKGIEK